jgi:uncharacterized membrane protein
MLALSLVLGILPLAGIALIFANGMIVISPFSATIDGLFMTLILLMLSGVFMLNVLWELRDMGIIKNKKKAAPVPAKTPAAKTA